MKIGNVFRKYQEILFWLIIGISLDAAFLMVKDSPLIADEGYHLPQISGFLSGNYVTSPHLTVIPTYHFIMAGILKLIGAESVTEARLVTFMGSAVSIWFFYVIVRRLWPDQRYLRTAQFVFFPILFPMHFLVYTDTWALAFVLVALERALANRPWQSAAGIAIAVLMRQPNLAWAGMIWGLLVWQPGPTCVTWQFIKDRWKQSTLPFGIIGVGFIIFMVCNRGIAVGDKAQHGIVLNPANLWFFGLCFFLMFIPTCIGTILRHWNHLRGHQVAAALGFGVGIAIFLRTYEASHQYNQASLWFYLRNRILHWTTEIAAIKLSTFIPACLGLAGFILGPVKEGRFRIMVPFSLISILVMPLIEQRYYLVPFAIFLAFRRLEQLRFEFLNTVFYICAAFLMQWGISRNFLFL